MVDCAEFWGFIGLKSYFGILYLGFDRYQSRGVKGFIQDVCKIIVGFAMITHVLDVG